MKKIIMLLILLNIARPSHQEPPIDHSGRVEVIENMEELRRLRGAPFSPYRLKRYMELTGIYKAEMVYKQAVLETGNFRSVIFRENHNLFGMKLPHSRFTTACGEARGHARYDHWTDSVDDYALWQEFYLDGGYDLSDYYSFLRELPYAEDPHYIAKLENLEL